MHGKMFCWCGGCIFQKGAICIDGDDKCIRDTLWTSIWSKEIPFSWGSTAETNFFSFLCEHTSFHDMGIYGNFFASLGQDPLIFVEANKFARWMIPSLLSYAALHPLVKFLQS